MNILKKIENKILFKYKQKWFNDLLTQKSTESNSFPKYELQSKHLQNAKLLTNRHELLDLMPKNAICAEIGVNEGEFSEEILNITTPQKLYLIDAWDDAFYHNGLRDLVLKKFDKKIKEDKVDIRIGLSTNELPKFAENFFDWVYLDTAHTYEITIAELNILKTKMKPNGIIAGHDYVTGWWNGWFRYGVIEAVHQFCVENNWELLYLTTETHQHRSFAIRKL